MTALGAFLEAHSYSGGLRHTPYLNGAPRPSWAPAADSVGWRDEFAIDADDVVVEFHQREGAAGPVSWLAAYRTSIDTQFGDRRNHAGMGIWLHGERIADARALLSALEQLSRVLAKDPRPEALAGKVADFANDPYLPRYLLPAERLPADWRGAPASTTTLVETAYRFISAPSFEAALGPLVEEVARCSLDWTGKRLAPRTLILVSPRAAAPEDRSFAATADPGSFLADLLERLPTAFEDERRALLEAEGKLQTSRAQWETERRDQQDAWDRERADLQMLDRQPTTPEGIAIRLNAISTQLRALEAAGRTVQQAAPKPATPMPRLASPPPPPTRRHSNEPVDRAPADGANWEWFIYGAVVILLLDALIFAISKIAFY